MGKVIKHEVLTSKLALSECTDGFWLYDETRGMNLAMRAKTEREAFIKALEYYQDRLKDVESAHKSLTKRVNEFVSQFKEDDECDC
jgi:hypothetical protein